MAQTIGMMVAGLLAVYLSYITFRRVLGDRDDPTASVAARSDTGSFTFLLSGWWLVVAVGLILLGLLWPLPQESPSIIAIIALVVAVHWYIERRERR